MAADRVRRCAVCGFECIGLADFSIHAASHAGERSGRSLRPASCWRCASDIDVNEGLTCQVCGFTLPPPVNRPTPDVQT
jgi:hypothetical protein